MTIADVSFGDVPPRRAWRGRTVPGRAAEAIAASLQIVLTEEQRIACRYLERYGFRFCVDFGVTNCVAMFQGHFRRQAERVVG